MIQALKSLWLVLSGNVWSKKTEDLSFMMLESDAKFEEKITCAVENNMRNLANFYESTWKS